MGCVLGVLRFEFGELFSSALSLFPDWMTNQRNDISIDYVDSHSSMGTVCKQINQKLIHNVCFGCDHSATEN